MAVGSKGSFATVDPNQGIIDVAGMARRESARQSEIQEKSNLLEGRYITKAREIGDALSKPQPKQTGQLTFDQINFKAASLLRDEQAKVLNRLGSSRLGDGMSIPEMRAEAAKYENRFDNYADKMSMMKPAIDNFMEVVSNDNLSRAIGGDFTGEDGIGTKILNGEIEDVILDKDGEPLLIVNGKRMTVDRLHGFFSSPILKRDLTDDANTTSGELVERIRENVGAVNDNLEYYQTRFEEGMTVDQESEVRQKGEAIAKDPKFVGDLWFQYTQDETGEGQTGIFTPDDLTDTQLENLAQWSGNKMVTLVNNRMKDTIKDSFNYTERGKAIVRANKRKENEPKPINIEAVRTDSLVEGAYAGGDLLGNSLAFNLPYSEEEPINLRVGGRNMIVPSTTFKSLSLDENDNLVISGNAMISKGDKEKVENVWATKSTQKGTYTASEVVEEVKEMARKGVLDNEDLATQLLLQQITTMTEKGLFDENGKFVGTDKDKTLTRDLVSSFDQVTGVLPTFEQPRIAKDLGYSSVAEMKKAIKDAQEEEEQAQQTGTNNRQNGL